MRCFLIGGDCHLSLVTRAYGSFDTAIHSCMCIRRFSLGVIICTRSTFFKVYYVWLLSLELFSDQWHSLSLVVRYVGARSVHFFDALSLSRFFLDWARPYGDEKSILVLWYRMYIEFISQHPVYSVAETRILERALVYSTTAKGTWRTLHISTNF
jgi:hypothetical protein